MDVDEQTRFVIMEMRRYRKVDDTIFELCQKTGGQWPETAAFVHQVMAANKDKVQAERQPLIAAIGVALVIAGLGGMIGVTIATLDGWIVFILRLPIPYLGNALLFGFSLMLVVGGLQGLLQMAFKLKPGGD